MVKRLLHIAFFSCLLTAVPMDCCATAAMEVVGINDFQSITITVKGKTLYISGANGMNLQIFDLAGVCVKNTKIEGAEVKFELALSKGCYMVKVGNVVRKVFIR